MNTPTKLFPAFERLVERSPAFSNAKGMLAARLPRILGQGQTRAEGLKLPPAEIERQQELIALSFPDGVTPDAEVLKEIEDASRAVEELKARMRNVEHRRRFALEVLHKLKTTQKGVKDNQFYAGRLVLVPDNSGQ